MKHVRGIIALGVCAALFCGCNSGGGSGNGDAGSTSAPGVQPAPALEGFSYTTLASSYELGIEIPSNAPSFTQGDPTSFTVDPELPDGISLDSSTGVISGRPSTTSPTTVYTVTAWVALRAR